jgi:hypothetical protein
MNWNVFRDNNRYHLFWQCNNDCQMILTIQTVQEGNIGCWKWMSLWNIMSAKQDDLIVINGNTSSKEIVSDERLVGLWLNENKNWPCQLEDLKNVFSVRQSFFKTCSDLKWLVFIWRKKCTVPTLFLIGFRLNFVFRNWLKWVFFFFFQMPSHGQIYWAWCENNMSGLLRGIRNTLIP